LFESFSVWRASSISTAFNESTDSASAPRLLCAALNQATASASYAGLLMKKFVMNCFRVRRAARARREGNAAILPRSSLRMVSSEIVSSPPRFCTAYWIRSSVGFACSTYGAGFRNDRKIAEVAHARPVLRLVVADRDPVVTSCSSPPMPTSA
jgi:hypothetical protein